jgi:hypothetical protein
MTYFEFTLMDGRSFSLIPHHVRGIIHDPSRRATAVIMNNGDVYHAREDESALKARLAEAIDDSSLEIKHG